METGDERISDESIKIGLKQSVHVPEKLKKELLDFLDGYMTAVARTCMQQELKPMDDAPWGAGFNAARGLIQNATEKESYKVELQYFKPSGKFGYDAEFETNAFYWDVPGLLRQMNSDGKLPGLANGRWEGSIHIWSEAKGYPMLVTGMVR